MSTFQPGVPQPGEYSPALAGYIGKAKPFADPIQKLNEQLAEVLSLLRPIDQVKQHHRYAPGKWSVKEVLGHLIDAERIFAYRVLRVGRTDQTPLPSFDENVYAAASEAERQDWNEMLEEFEHVRKASILLLRHLPEAAWTRTGTASGAPISVRALAYIMIGHVAHHLDILRERYW
jgi:uncharacterized damage-inducible protein DinB